MGFADRLADAFKREGVQELDNPYMRALRQQRVAWATRRVMGQIQGEHFKGDRA